MPTREVRADDRPRVDCRRGRRVEFHRVDAAKLYGAKTAWWGIDQGLLADACRIRTGRHEEDWVLTDFDQAALSSTHPTLARLSG